ncbi:amidohydrolase family protein [Phenylobacterium sp.]|jgi:imidazolonepropionase-like amidohydrolase|uniref:amidohydrolase family protein n=1 Tax=Phenylobacterium sp. TaxID=1871053 RepID=UPI002E2FEC53|nr:amidohydrolase family protein [Phenylobacterium sp.]HEX3367453.1 amidohydrolase family protein [Phenylobacterium sp.]
MGLRAAASALGLGAVLATSAQAAPQPPWLADPFPSTYRAPTAPDLLVRGATVLDGAGHRLEGADVLTHAGKIVAVGKGLRLPTGGREVDARGRWVTPGVIDIHTHDGVYVLPLTDIDHDSGDVAELSDPNAADTRVENAVNPQDVAFSRALEHGVTTVQILPGSSPIFSGRSVMVHPIRANTVAEMKLPNAPQGFKMACGENPKEEDAATHRGPTSRQGEVAFIRSAFLDAQDYRRDWDAYAAGKGPAPKRDLKRETLAGVLAGDVHIHMHCYRADDMATMLSVAREFGFHVAAFHHAVEAYKIPQLFRAEGVCAAVWGGWWGYKMEALDAIRATAGLLDEEGVCVTMHSDSPAEGQRLNLEAAKAAGAARRIGVVVPPERMIRWITANPAKALGLGDRIGTLADGYDADLVLWSADPFSVYAKADLVVIDGAVAFDRAHPPAAPASDFVLGRKAMQP